MQREIVGLSPTTREDDALSPHAKAAGDPLARILKPPARGATLSVHRGGVASRSNRLKPGLAGLRPER
jgi:hypothetical protein